MYTYNTQETRAVCACAATTEKTQDGHQSANKYKHRRQFLEQNKKTGSRCAVQQVGVDWRLTIDVHVETETQDTSAT